MTPAQCKEARRLLGMTRKRLAAASCISLGVISNFEIRGYVQRSHAGASPQERLGAIRSALQVAGVEFTDSSEPGVSLRERTP